MNVSRSTCFKFTTEWNIPPSDRARREAFEMSLEKSGFRPERIIRYDQDFLMCTMPTTAKGTAKLSPGRGVKINHLYYWSDTSGTLSLSNGKSRSAMTPLTPGRHTPSAEISGWNAIPNATRRSGAARRERGHASQVELRKQALSNTRRSISTWQCQDTRYIPRVGRGRGDITNPAAARPRIGWDAGKPQRICARLCGRRRFPNNGQ